MCSAVVLYGTGIVAVLWASIAQLLNSQNRGVSDCAKSAIILSSASVEALWHIFQFEWDDSSGMFDSSIYRLFEMLDKHIQPDLLIVDSH